MAEEIKILDRSALEKAVIEEKSARAKRCMKRIEAILAEENCELEAHPILVPAGEGLFGFTANVGSRAL